MLELVGDPLDRGGGPARDLRERLRRAGHSTRHRISVRAGLRIAEHLDQALLHLRRHRVLDPLGLLVRLPPLVAEEVDEHPLGEPMPADDVSREVAAATGKMHFFMTVERDEPFALEAVEHFRNGRRGHSHEARQAGADDGATLIGERVDGLEILLDRRRAQHASPILDPGGRKMLGSLEAVRGA